MYERRMVEHVKRRNVHEALELYNEMKTEQVPLSKRICNNMLSLQPEDTEATLQMARLSNTVLEDMTKGGIGIQEPTLSNAIRLQVANEPQLLTAAGDRPFNRWQLGTCKGLKTSLSVW